MRARSWSRRGVGALLLVGLGVVSAVGFARSRTQQPRHPIELTGADWRQMKPRERELYLSGFLAGAAAEQVRALALDHGRASDSGAVSSGAVEALRSAARLHYRFAPSVYSVQLDDFYWWTDRRAIPILDALIAINRAMLQQQPDGGP